VISSYELLIMSFGNKISTLQEAQTAGIQTLMICWPISLTAANFLIITLQDNRKKEFVALMRAI